MAALSTIIMESSTSIENNTNSVNSDLANSTTNKPPDEDFYLRYHVGQRGRCGLDYLEFEVFSGGKLRYVNKSSYDDDDESYHHHHHHDYDNAAADASMLCRELYVGPGVVEEIKRMVQDSGLIHLNDSQWTEPFCRRDAGIQELEVKTDGHHVCFATIELSKLDIARSKDPNGLQVFYHLGCDLKSLVMTLISCHFTERPFG